MGSATKRSATSSSKRNATASEIHDRLQKTMNSFSEEDKLEFKDAVRDLKVMVGKCSTPQSPGARARTEGFGRTCTPRMICLFLYWKYGFLFSKG